MRDLTRRPVALWVLQAGIVAVFLPLVGLDPFFARFVERQPDFPALLADIASATARYKVWVLVTGAFLAVACGRWLFRDRAPLGTVAAFSVLAHLAVGLRVLQFPYCIDDAYIDFRHVRNLAESGSLDYNIGDPVMAFTSHLHLLILSAAALLTGSRDIAVLSQTLNVALELLNLCLVFAILRKVGRRDGVALFGAALYALSFYHVKESFIGKESCLVVFLVGLSIWAVLEGRPRLLAWTAALAFLARPEGALFVLLAFVWSRRTAPDVRASLRVWAGPAAAVAAWYLVLLLHFGTVLPHGMIAKRIVMKDPPLEALLHIANFLVAGFTGFQPPYTYAKPFLLALALGGSWLAVRRFEPLRFYFWAACAMIGFFAVGNPPILQYFSWYFAWISLLPIFVIPMALHQLEGSARPVVAGLAAFWLLAAAANQPHEKWPSLPVRLPKPFFYWDEEFERLLRYRDAAALLEKTADPRAQVAVGEPGMFGYSYPGRVLDLSGLASEEVLRYFPSGKRSFGFVAPARAVEALAPEYVLILHYAARDGLLLDEFFLKHYQTVKVWPVDVYGGQGLHLFRRGPRA